MNIQMNPLLTEEEKNLIENYLQLKRQKNPKITKKLFLWSFLLSIFGFIGHLLLAYFLSPNDEIAELYRYLDTYSLRAVIHGYGIILVPIYIKIVLLSFLLLLLYTVIRIIINGCDIYRINRWKEYLAFLETSGLRTFSEEDFKQVHEYSQASHNVIHWNHVLLHYFYLAFFCLSNLLLFTIAVISFPISDTSSPLFVLDDILFLCGTFFVLFILYCFWYRVISIQTMKTMQEWEQEVIDEIPGMLTQIQKKYDALLKKQRDKIK